MTRKNTQIGRWKSKIMKYIWNVLERDIRMNNFSFDLIYKKDESKGTFFSLRNMIYTTIYLNLNSEKQSYPNEFPVIQSKRE
mmetsp:Transcript_22843/g.45914  ORF Transcript_22843/g.45914 Transcript_22843/m.45914 type:complete len:82 (+) Transcript_22843:786-1031(+)